MASQPRPNTTNSTDSQASMTKQAASPGNPNSSPAAPPSFALDGTPPNPELLALKALLSAAERRLQAISQDPTPTLAWYRKRQTARLAAVKVQIRDLKEAIAAKTP